MPIQLKVVAVLAEPPELEKMLAVVNACRNAGVSLPPETVEFLGDPLESHESDVEAIKHRILNRTLLEIPLRETNDIKLDIPNLPEGTIHLNLFTVEVDEPEQVVEAVEEELVQSEVEEIEPPPRLTTSIDRPVVSPKDFERCGRLIGTVTKQDLNNGTYFLLWMEEREDKEPKAMMWHIENEDEDERAQRFVDAAHWRSWYTPDDLRAMPEKSGAWGVRYTYVGVNPSFVVYVTEPNWNEPGNTGYDKEASLAKRMSQEEAIELTLSLSTYRHAEPEDDDHLYYEPVLLQDVL